MKKLSLILIAMLLLFLTACGGKEELPPKQLPIVNRQMLALLSQLGISADTVNGGGGGYVPL